MGTDEQFKESLKIFQKLDARSFELLKAAVAGFASKDGWGVRDTVNAAVDFARLIYVKDESEKVDYGKML